jgi:hypothetical protein
MRKFNLNDTIKVLLYEEGEKMYLEYYAPFMKVVKKDSKGYVAMQMWEFMKIFGEKCVMGKELPFDTNIYLDL